jgi:formylmethanofuran dehydrogenase subunit E
MCNAGEMCLLPVDNVMLEGEGCNGSRCSKCQGPFHHVCLFVFEGEIFCSKCFKQYVVSQCSTETLFKELF